jgi:hypothetical protein
VKYLVWVPLTIFYNYLCCLIAVKVGGRDFWMNYLLLTLIGVIPTWSLAAYWSKNLIFDGLLYDSTLVISGVFIMAYMGQAQHFTVMNWLGVVLAVVGLTMVRLHA